MINLQSFTYTLSSGEGEGTLANDLTFELLPLKENYDVYMVQCTNFAITTSNLVTPEPYYHLVADDFAENGYFIGLNNNQCILGTLNTSNNVATMTHGEGSVFIVKNMRGRRRVRFRLYTPSLQVVPDAQLLPASGRVVYWTATLLFTPII